MDSPERSSPVEGVAHKKKASSRLLEKINLVDLVEKLSKSRAKIGRVR
jgi:hypothetical protein